MDRGTVIQLVSMLDNGMSNILKGDEYPWESSKPISTDHMHLSPIDYGAYDALYTLREHLQEYIENQISAMEMETGE